ncbi:MAG: hypothetical protein ACO1OB_11470 [Archangium sp.]
MRRLAWCAAVAVVACGRTEVVDFPLDFGELPDGGFIDGGTLLDGGVNDGGSTGDGGISDGGTSDGGRPDGGMTEDGGVVDAGPPPCPISWEATVTVTISITADDSRRVWVNGLHGESTTNQWTQPTRFTTTFFRHPQRRNVVTVYVTNMQNQSGLDRGLLADIRVGQSTVMTDSRWKQRGGNDGGWDINDAAWLNPAFDDSNWGDSVEQATNGSAPWGRVNTIHFNAMWIWPWNSAGTVKPVFEPVFFRRTLYVDMNGELVDAPAACP